MAQQAINTGVTGKGIPNGIATGIDWKSADFSTLEGKQALAEAISGYYKDLSFKTTRTGHTGTLPVAPDLDINSYIERADAGIASLFRSVDRSASSNPTYQFANVSRGAVIFEQQKEGDPARIQKISSGSPQSVSSVTWHGALGIDDEARRFDAYAEFEEEVQSVPQLWDNKHHSNLAALITALGAGIDQTWDTAGADQTEKFVNTLNAAHATIMEDAGDVYGVADDETLTLVYNHRDAALITKALASALTLPNDNNSKTQLEFNLQRVKTRRVPAGKVYLALPGYDMVDVLWDDLYSEYGRDYMRGADAYVWRTRRNAAIGNTAQVRRITPA